MERSRSKRGYYYQDHENEAVGSRNKQRYSNHHSYSNSNSSNTSFGRYQRNPNPSSNSYSPGNGYRGSKPNSGNQDSSTSSAASLPTSFRILCHDSKVGGVIGKSGSIIKQIRQQTGAWVNVHELVAGDEERIIEITDSRRRDTDGRISTYSPAEAALILIHDRILTCEPLGGDGPEEGEYSRGYNGGGGGVGVNNRVATRMVVSRMHVGCLLGKGGKIIEQMRVETKTQIRILPRDHNLPRCISISEEIVQVVGEVNNVKSAVEIIAARLKESQYRDRNHFHNRLHSPESSFTDDDYSHTNNSVRRASGDVVSFVSRSSGSSYRSNGYTARQLGYSADGSSVFNPDGPETFCGDDLVFRMLCPIDRVNRVIGEPDGILELLQNEIGVDVKLGEQVTGSDEQIVIISSDEGPDDELFPAQEALLHIQSRIVDLSADQENVIRTRLLVSSGEIRCFEGQDASIFEMERTTGAKIQIVTKDNLPTIVSATDELLQIEGDIKAARDALVEVTCRLRSFVYRDFYNKDVPGSITNAFGTEGSSPVNVPHVRDGQTDIDTPISPFQNSQAAIGQPKDIFIQSTVDTMKQSLVEAMKKSEMERRDDLPVPVNRIAVPLVTRSILEVVIPEHAAPKLLTKSKNKLAQISELSGANVTLVEDRPDVTEKVIKISGTPEQAERAQSLLQGFILSTLEDGL